MKRAFRSTQSLYRLGHLTHRAFAAFLLLVLLIQISPLAVTAEPPAVDSDQECSEYYRPLRVCQDDVGFGGMLADHSWLPTCNLAPVCCAHVIVYPARSPDPLPPGHAQRLLRPPRA